MGRDDSLTEEQREANLRSWLRPQGHPASGTGDPDSEYSSAPDGWIPKVSDELATKIWFLVLKHLGRGGRPPNVIPKEFLDDVREL